MDFLRATITRPSPRGHIHLPLRWWLRPHKVVCPDLYYHQIRPVDRMVMYTCRDGPFWVGNNWHAYRIHLSGKRPLYLPYLTDHIWYYGTEPVRLEPVTRLQLLMESIWPAS